MGLFDKRDKKRGDDFDSPVEQVDLSAVPAAAKAAADTAPSKAPNAATAAAPGQPEPPRAETRRSAPPVSDDYGIQKAIELMRTLPQDNVELVVQVVKFSLESVGIKLPIIIEDATRRQQDIQGRIGVLRGEIAEHEKEIKLRREEIERLETDFKETSTVRERLELAETIGKAKSTEPRTSESSATASGSLPRVTKPTTPPAMSASGAGTFPQAPTKK